MIHLPSLRQLRYLVALADQGHFGRAAESQNVTQSTLSAGLAELEAILGAPLVDRSRRQVALTALGETVTARARRLLIDAEELTEMARSSRDPLTSLVRLGVIPTIAPYILPRALPAARKAYPKLQLHLVEEKTGRLVDDLHAGRLDAALIALPYETGATDHVLLGHDPFLLACPFDHPLAQADLIKPAALRHETLLLLQDGHCLREHALSACRLVTAPAGGVEATSLATLVQMVALGLGVTLLPTLAAARGLLDGTGLVTRPVAGNPSRDLALVWRKGTHRAAEFKLLAELFKPALGGVPKKGPYKPPERPRRANSS